MARLWALMLERLTLAALAAVVALAVFVFVAYDVVAGSTRRLDHGIAAFFSAHQTPMLHLLMQAVSLFGNEGAQALIAIACVLGFRRRPELRANALSILVAIGGGQGLIFGLKVLFHRPRPAVAFAHLGYSFPSGHSFFAVTLYGMVAYWLTRPADGGPRRRWAWPVAVMLILLIGFSRVYLGVHYASDVVAGFAVAVPWLWACLALPKAFGLTRRKLNAPHE